MKRIHFFKENPYSKAIDFLIEKSIIVGIAIYFLIDITLVYWNTNIVISQKLLLVSLSIIAYNLIKKQITVDKKYVYIIQFLGICLITTFLFLDINKYLICYATITVILSFYYTIPIPFIRLTIRDFATIKMLSVAVVWAIVTVVLPLILASAFSDNRNSNSALFWYIVHRVLYIFIVMIPFEIRDSKQDNLHFKTLIQKIGVLKTKIIGYMLICVWCIITGFHTLEVLLGVVLVFILMYSTEKQKRYYSSLYVELIPVIWWFLLMFQKYI